MKSSELFGVVVRSLGLIVMLYGLWHFAYAFFLAIGAFQDDLLDPAPRSEYVISGGARFAVGLLLLRFASGIVRFSYPDPPTQEAPEGTITAQTTNT